MKQAAKRANRTDEPMFLCVLRAKSLPDDDIKKKKAKVRAAKGKAESKRRQLMKETGPDRKVVPIKEVIRTKLEEADPTIRDKLKDILEE